MIFLGARVSQCASRLIMKLIRWFLLLSISLRSPHITEIGIALIGITRFGRVGVSVLQQSAQEYAHLSDYSPTRPSVNHVAFAICMRDF